MNHLKSLLIHVLFVAVCIAQQPPSIQLKVKEKSGFLGLGGPRILEIQLSNQNRQLPLSSENVHAGQYYYFFCKPAGDWKIDADVIKDDISKLVIYQNEQKLQIAWKSDVLVEGNNTSVLLGFPKTVKIYQLFLFQIPVGETTTQGEFKIPQELWPGYSVIMDLLAQADRRIASNQNRDAVSFLERILQNPALQIFPLFDEVKDKRTKKGSS